MNGGKLFLCIVIVFIACAIVFDTSDNILFNLVQKLADFNFVDPFSYIYRNVRLTAPENSGDVGQDVLAWIVYIGNLLVTPLKAVYYLVEWAVLMIGKVFSLFPIKDNYSQLYSARILQLLV